MMVIVMVTPGSAPPITPISVPMNRGTRYLRCRIEMSAVPSSSSMAHQPVHVPRGSSTSR